jgi:hypothetical protein
MAANDIVGRPEEAKMAGGDSRSPENFASAQRIVLDTLSSHAILSTQPRRLAVRKRLEFLGFLGSFGITESRLRKG